MIRTLSSQAVKDRQRLEPVTDIAGVAVEKQQGAARLRMWKVPAVYPRAVGCLQPYVLRVESDTLRRGEKRARRQEHEPALEQIKRQTQSAVDGRREERVLEDHAHRIGLTRSAPFLKREVRGARPSTHPGSRTGTSRDCPGTRRRSYANRCRNRWPGASRDRAQSCWRQWHI